MVKEDMLEFMGNILLGIVCPFIFLVSSNPYKDLCNNTIGEDEENGDCK